MNRLDWNFLKSFIAVVEQGSLSKAAKALKISQPTIGRHIEQLEADLNVQLFDRTGRGFRVTEMGIEIATEAKKMDEYASRISNVVHMKSSNLAGTVRITASNVMALNCLPEVIAKLRGKFPEIQYEINPNDKVENLLEREADIALRMVPPQQKDLISKKVGELSLGIYVGKSYPRFNETQERLRGKNVQALLEFDLIGQDNVSDIIDGLAERGIHSSREHYAVRSDNYLLHFELLKKGLGIGFCVNFVAKPETSMVRLFEDLPLPSLPIWLTAHRELQTNARTRLVFDELSKVAWPT